MKLPSCDGANAAAVFLLNTANQKPTNSIGKRITRTILVSILLTITTIYRFIKRVFNRSK